MIRNSLRGCAWALLVALTGLTACADSTYTSGMPATQHQQQVLPGNQPTGMSAAPGDTVGGMPATEHQKDVLGVDD